MLRAFMPIAALALAGCAMQGNVPNGSGAQSAVEEVYAVRMLREERAPKPEWCTPERTGFQTPAGGFVVEDRYTMWSPAVRSADGRVTDAKAAKIGEMHNCLAATAERGVFALYGEGTLAGVPFTGAGNCQLLRGDFPEKGVSSLRCSSDVRNLPAPYVGGLLTTSTLGNKAVLGETSDPPGYLNPTIAWVRLWRKR